MEAKLWECNIHVSLELQVFFSARYILLSAVKSHRVHELHPLLPGPALSTAAIALKDGYEQSSNEHHLYTQTSHHANCVLCYILCLLPLNFCSSSSAQASMLISGITRVALRVKSLSLCRTCSPCVYLSCAFTSVWY